MERVQRSERLERERLPSSFGNFTTNSEQVPPCRSLGEVRAPVGQLSLSERLYPGGANQRAVAFNHCKV